MFTWCLDGTHRSVFCFTQVSLSNPGMDDQLTLSEVEALTRFLPNWQTFAPHHQQSITLEYGALPEPIPPRQDKDSANDNTELCVVYSSTISLCGQKEPPLKFVVKLNRDMYIFCADTLQLIVSALCSLIVHKHTRRQQHGQINNSYQPCFRVATVFCLLLNVCDNKFTQSILILYVFLCNLLFFLFLPIEFKN